MAIHKWHHQDIGNVRLLCHHTSSRPRHPPPSKKWFHLGLTPLPKSTVPQKPEPFSAAGCPYVYLEPTCRCLCQNFYQWTQGWVHQVTRHNTTNRAQTTSVGLHHYAFAKRYPWVNLSIRKAVELMVKQRAVNLKDNDQLWSSLEKIHRWKRLLQCEEH